MCPQSVTVAMQISQEGSAGFGSEHLVEVLGQALPSAPLLLRHLTSSGVFVTGGELMRLL